MSTAGYSYYPVYSITTASVSQTSALPCTVRTDGFAGVCAPYADNEWPVETKIDARITITSIRAMPPRVELDESEKKHLTIGGVHPSGARHTISERLMQGKRCMDAAEAGAQVGKTGDHGVALLRPQQKVVMVD